MSDANQLFLMVVATACFCGWQLGGIRIRYWLKAGDNVRILTVLGLTYFAGLAFGFVTGLEYLQ